MGRCAKRENEADMENYPSTLVIHLFLTICLYELSMYLKNKIPLSVCSYRVFCLLGDGEVSEGSVWEAMAFASYYQLDNLVAILDINRLGQSDPAPLQHHVEKYQRRCEAFG